MIHVCDSNVWLAPSLSEHAHHGAVRAWLQTVDDPESIVFCRAAQESYLRLLTNSAVLAPYGEPPLSNKAAWSVYEALAADYRVVVRADEPAGVERRWRQLGVRGTASPTLWMDAYLAAFAVCAGYRMVTTDAVFRQFADLDVRVLGGKGA